MTEFLGGSLSADDEALVIAHLQDCAACDLLAHTMSEAPVVHKMLALAAHTSEPLAPGSLTELKARLQALAYLDEADDASLGEAMSATITRGDTKRNEPSLVTSATGRRLGKFEIVRELGAGGFGVVYLAKDTVLRRNVALKLPRSGMLADPGARCRFEREAQALARLDHPHIVPVYEAGEADGTCYLAVAYCDGPTLETWRQARDAPIDPRTSACIVLALATAVEHAHQHGILHRDIKPANVLISSAQSGQDLPFVPRLADFGLAKIADHGLHQTQNGMILGTPQYLAPEQAAGLVDRIGPWTDVYGLGAVLFELLTGQPPLCGANNIDTLRRVLMDEPAMPGQLVSAVPAELDAVVMKCLAKTTTSRYATAQELADDLQRFLAAEPVRASQIGIVARCWKRGKKQPWIGAAAILLAVCAAAAGLLMFSSIPGGGREEVSSSAKLAANAADSLAADRQLGVTPVKEAAASDEPPGTSQSVEAIHDLNSSLVSLKTLHGSASHATLTDSIGSVLAINALDSGWWGSNNNSHRSGTKNYLVARTNHNYFVFDLGAVRHKITAAELRLAVPANNGYNSGDPHENYALFDVSTPLAELQSNGTGRSDIFHDLASGAIYAKQKFVNDDEGTVKSIPLNAEGIQALNAAAGELFALGGALTTTDGTGGALFANSGEFSLTKQLVLILEHPTTKRYSFRLEEGQRAFIELRPARGRTTLAIQDSSGATLAWGVPGGNQNQRISNLVAPASSTYFIVVQAAEQTTYNLFVTRRAVLENEPNNTRQSPQPIAPGELRAARPTPPVIVPAHLAMTEGNRGNGSPFNLEAHELRSMRYQQIYSNSEFVEPGLITAIRFRRNRGEPTFMTAGIDIKINLSYAATTITSLSPTFADNVGPGATTVLDTTNLTLSSTGSGSPQPFDIVIPLTTAFYFDPSQGDLLMDIFMRNAPATVQFDLSCRGEQGTMRRVFSRNVNSASGTIDFTSEPSLAGLVTRFDMTPRVAPNGSEAGSSPNDISWSVLGTIAPPPVVPSRDVNTSLDGANCYPFHLSKVELSSMRYQQLYSHTEFTQPGTITAIRLRRNVSEPPFTTPGIDIRIDLGYAATSVANPSLTFANNVGIEATTVLDTPDLTLSSTSTNVPRPFDVVIPLQRPFYYNPSQGDLLMDVFMRNSPATARISSSGRAQPLVTRRVYAPDVNAATGSTGANFLGLLITRFDMAPDEDWYSFEMPSAGTPLRLEIVTLSGAAGQPTNDLIPRLEVFDPAGARVAIDEALPDGCGRCLEFAAADAGKYHVRVTGADATTGAYLMTCASAAK